MCVECRAPCASCGVTRAPAVHAQVLRVLAAFADLLHQAPAAAGQEEAAAPLPPPSQPDPALDLALPAAVPTGSGRSTQAAAARGTGRALQLPRKKTVAQQQRQQLQQQQQKKEEEEEGLPGVLAGAAETMPESSAKQGKGRSGGLKAALLAPFKSLSSSFKVRGQSRRDKGRGRGRA